MRNVRTKAAQIETLAAGIDEDAGSAEERVLDLARETEALLAVDTSN